ncbi:hypothetical protein [Streptomyces sp. S465]|uniref:hypothetical protein n=1 Tax=Streptomyces sp. S465 TaxID=2979468 RepID=UPI0022A8685D|nr:hypothetical protein [Streptomyces sp. S465]WAP54318.1 hypothetical protein N6H00_04640 [Streptomyces sp. S465]
MSTHDELPLADYDHLPLSALQHRIRGLGAEQLGQLLEYERSHADRLPVVEVLTARLRQLESGATPSPGEPGAEPLPERPSPPRGGSPVTPQTAAEPSPPPRHGHPDHPGQTE